MLHIRMRKGSANSGRGAERFVNELVARVRRAGASGPLTVRADSAFHSSKVIKVIKTCRRLKVAFSITVNRLRRCAGPGRLGAMPHARGGHPPASAGGPTR